MIPNTTLRELKKLYPTIDFPDGLDDIEILFVNYYKTETNGPQYGVFKDPETGKTIYLVDSKVEHVEKLLKFLYVKKSIEEKILDKLVDEDKEVLNQILNLEKIKKFKIENLEDLCIDYLYNKPKYKDIFLPSGESVTSIMKDIFLKIFKIGHKKNYDDTVINEISNKFYYTDKDYDTPSIRAEYVFNIISNNPNYKDFLSKILEYVNKGKESKESKQSLSFSDFDKIFFAKIRDNLDLFKSINLLPEFTINEDDYDKFGYEILMDYILSKEPNCDLAFKECKIISSKKSRKEYSVIQLHKPFKNLRFFGVDQEFLRRLDKKQVQNYCGNFITKKDNKYYVTRNYPNKDSIKTYVFNSIEEAQDFITNKESIISAKGSKIDFHKGKTSDDFQTIITSAKYEKGDIVSVLNSESLFSKDFIYEQYNELLKSPNFKEFLTGEKQ